jgi:hypothetical protein
VQAPWQNGLAERWIGSCRRELLDHVIALNETHWRRLIRDYVGYYHHDRVHDPLQKDTPLPATLAGSGEVDVSVTIPDGRHIEMKPSADAVVVSSPRLGGLHHRYGWRAAA